MFNPYHVFFTQVLTRLDAETAHRFAATAMRVAGALPLIREGLRYGIGRPGSSRQEVFGRHLSGPLGVAAGFDKDVTMAPALDSLGFSFVEVGTVTALAQPGNPAPRLWRITHQRALRNRMGFNNSGAALAAKRLRRLRRTAHGRRMVLGVNIGKSKVTPAAEAVADYQASARAVAPYADYLVVNVSSPNTAGLRDLQQTNVLRPILATVRDTARAAAAREVPVLVKIAPDLNDADVDAVAALAAELELAGVVAVNTTINHDLGSGGVSGPPVRKRGLAVVRRVRAVLGDGPIIIGVGGISAPEDARAYLDAGATLLQAYTAFIYHGPTWPGRMNRALTR